MAPRKKKPPAARKAVKKPVINLKATEVKSATEKANEKAKAKTAEKVAEKSQPKVREQSTPKQEDSKSATASRPTSRAGEKPSDGAKQADDLTDRKKSKGKGLVLVSLVALLAAGIGGAWAFKTYGARYFADPNAVNAEQLAGVVARLEKLEGTAGTADKAKDMASGLEKLIGQNSATLATNKEIISANSEKLAGLEKTAREIRVALAKAVEEGNGPVAAANELQFQALTQKLAGLEKGLTNLKAQPVVDSSKELEDIKTRFDAFLIRLNAAEEQTTATAKSIDIVKAAQEKLGGSPASSLASAFTILRAKISRGGQFASELDVVAGQLPQETALDVLRPFASLGGPTLASLSKALEAVNLAPVSSTPDQSGSDNSGMFGAITNRLTGLVKVTKAGEVDWRVLKQQALQALAAGQVENAADLMKNAAGKPQGIADWLLLANDKIKIDQAVKALSSKIVARLSSSSESGSE